MLENINQMLKKWKKKQNTNIFHFKVFVCVQKMMMLMLLMMMIQVRDGRFLFFIRYVLTLSNFISAASSQQAKPSQQQQQKQRVNY
jgi:hypothetical protein